MKEKSVPANIKSLLESTYNNSVLSRVGDFAGVFRFGNEDLVSSTDGVGTKIRVACNCYSSEEDQSIAHHTIGADLVNHCINDILVVGADPLFFLNTFSFSDSSAERWMPDVIRGMVDAAKKVDMPLISGETAKVKWMFADGMYDVSGTIIGKVSYRHRLPKNNIEKGDIIVRIPCTGPSTNGFTLIQSIFCDENSSHEAKNAWENDSIKTECMYPHPSYYDTVRPMLDVFDIKALAHITGKGIYGNLNRVMGGKTYHIDHPKKNWPRVFNKIQQYGNLSDDTMFEEFNLGVGMAVVISPREVDDFNVNLQEQDIYASYIGEVC